MSGGLFVTFEGIEGAGKSTQVELVAERLRQDDIHPLLTREPGATSLGKALRSILLDRSAGRLEPVVEALLMVADRAEHVTRVVRPALAEGRVVLCDRHGDATLAYQGGGSGLDRDLLAGWNRAATGGLAPDLTVLLDLPAERARARLAARGGRTLDRFESEGDDFFDRVRRTYLELAAREPVRWLVLDALRPAEESARAIVAEIRARLARAGAGSGSGLPKS